MNKSLDPVLLSHGVDFNSTVTLPQRLSYKKGKIKSFKLYRLFSEKGPMSMTWSNLPSREKFIQYEDLPDATGWEDDDLVRKTYSPNW